jgi:hypothetical protein
VYPSGVGDIKAIRMKAIEMNASKRSSCTILVSILVGAGCAASDNNSGSLRNDSAVADG